MQKPKPGYKLVKSLFGKYEEIPEEWESYKLKNLSNKIGDGIHSTPRYVDNSDFYFINGNNLNNDSIVFFDSTKNVDKEEYLKYKLDLNENTILLSINGTIGNVALYNNEKIVLGKSACYINCNEKLNKKFLAYLLKSDCWTKYITRELTGTTISNLSLASVRNLPLLLPKIEEQQKIVSILSHVDELINHYDKVIENTTRLKQDLMQTLLTKGIGHKKFKKIKWGIGKELEIPVGWDVDEIQNHTKITTGSKNTQDKIESGKYPFFVRSQTIERINSFSYDGEAVLTAGDGVGTGKVFHYINGKFDFHQRVYMISDFDDVLDGYFFYIFFSNHFFNRAMSMTAKASVDSVRMNMIAEMSLLLPPLPEQQKIASILSNIDNQIMDLEFKKNHLETLKKGLMQNLLTGKIRVKI